MLYIHYNSIIEEKKIHFENTNKTINFAESIFTLVLNSTASFYKEKRKFLQKDKLTTLTDLTLSRLKKQLFSVFAVEKAARMIR